MVLVVVVGRAAPCWLENAEAFLGRIISPSEVSMNFPFPSVASTWVACAPGAGIMLQG